MKNSFSLQKISMRFKQFVFWLVTCSMMMNNVCRAQQMITASGRTETTIKQTGAVYDVTTKTISGDNAFNSFSTFNVYKDTTANLYLPDATKNLINLVHDSKTDISGVLNAYKDGKIGGNVYFLNPHGITVGATGIINVGSVIFATPTAEFLDEIIDATGFVSGAATDALLDGDYPINETGTVSVKGKVNALLGDIGIKAHGVEVSGRLNAQQLKLTDIVNVDGSGYTESFDLFPENAVEIFAADSINITGIISVGGKAGTADKHAQTKSVEIVAGKNVSFGETAQISTGTTQAYADAGDITVSSVGVVSDAAGASLLTGTVTFASGTALSATAAATGIGGEITATSAGNLAIGENTSFAVTGGTNGEVFIDAGSTDVNGGLYAGDITFTGSIINVLHDVTSSSGSLFFKATGTKEAGIIVNEGVVLKAARAIIV